MKRANSKQSLSASKNSRQSFREKKVMKISNNNYLHASKDETLLIASKSDQQHSVNIELNSNEHAIDLANKLSIQLPIITHTCATPVTTPTSSFRNLILPSKPIKVKVLNRKLRRKLSLDSTIDQLNVNTDV